MIINFRKFTGLRPISADNTPTESQAIICSNVNLRKGNIVPLRAPVGTGVIVPQSSHVLLENAHTRTIIGAPHESGIAHEFLRGSGLAYVSALSAYITHDDVIAGGFYPEEPSGELTVDVEEVLAPSTHGLGAEAHQVAQTASPLSTSALATPMFVNYQKAAQVGALYVYSTASVKQAIYDVLTTYTVEQFDSQGNATQVTLAVAIDRMVQLTKTQPDISRSSTSGSNTTTIITHYTDASGTVLDSISALVMQVGWYAHEMLAGYFPASFIANSVYTVPGDARNHPTETFQLRQIGTLVKPAHAPFLSGTAFCLSNTGNDVWPHGGLGACAVYVADHWMSLGSDVALAFYAAIDEAASAKADPAYVWRGLFTAQFVNANALEPFVPGTTTLDGGSEAYSSPVPRAYLYTFMDAFGRESKPSEPVTVTGHGDRGGAALHTVRVTEVIPSSVVNVNIYRALSPTNTTEADALIPEWVLVAHTTPQEASAGVLMPSVGTSGYAVLETINDRYGPDVPKFLCETADGHAVCTDETGTVIYVSERHHLHNFPFNRRLALPLGLRAMNIKTSADTIYIATDAYPIVVKVGEDKGSLGLQMQVYNLIHANYGILNPNSMVATGWGVLYWTPVGLMAVAGVNVSVVTQSLIDEDQLAPYTADCAAYHRGMYFGFTVDGCTMFDIPDPSFQDTPSAPMTTSTIGAQACEITIDGRLMILRPGRTELEEWNWVDGDPLPLTYRTYNQLLPSDTTFTSAKVVGVNVSGVLSCFDGVSMRWFRQVTDGKAVRVPPMRCTRSVSLRFVGTCDSIEAFELASSMEELAGS